MSRREFANLKELQDFARRNRKLFALVETAKFAERQRRLSPDQYQIVNVCYSQGVRRSDAIPEGGPEGGVGCRWDQAAQGKGTLVRTIMAARILPARAPYQRSPTRTPLAWNSDLGGVPK